MTTPRSSHTLYFAALLCCSLIACGEVTDEETPDVTTEAPAADMGTQADQDGAPPAQMPEMGVDMPAPPQKDMTAAMEVDASPLGPDDRPAEVTLPLDFANDREVPLVILLHGYGVNAFLQDRLFGLTPRTTRRDFIAVLPDGLVDARGSQYWNATNACCDFYESGVDDVAYIEDLIDEATERYTIDTGRVYVMGHSNGGFMSYTMACEIAGKVTGIMALAGTTHTDPDACTPSEPVAILHAHGTADHLIPYDGGMLRPPVNKPIPSVQTTVERWAAFNDCAMPPQTEEAARDYLNTLAGNETDVTTYDDCAASGPVQLMRMNDAEHIPNLNDAFMDDVLDFLFAVDRTP